MTTKHTNLVILLATFAIMWISCRKDVEAPATSSENQLIEKIVQTPYGAKPSSQVHKIKNTEMISVANGRLVKLEIATGKMLEDFGPVEDDHNSSLLTSSNATIAGPGYQTSYAIPSGKVISSFSSDFTVPANPNNNKTLFLWPGAISSDYNSTFVQPVLGWSNTTDGQDYWTINNWYAIVSRYFNSGNIRVSPGTHLTGKMQLVSSTSNKWTYKTSFVGYPSIDITAQFSKPVTTLFEDWETYTTSYLDFPPQPSATMGNIQLYYQGSTANQPITWGLDGNNAVSTPSGKNTEVINNGTNSSQVIFYFR